MAGSPVPRSVPGSDAQISGRSGATAGSGSQIAAFGANPTPFVIPNCPPGVSVSLSIVRLQRFGPRLLSTNSVPEVLPGVRYAWLGVAKPAAAARTRRSKPNLLIS
jgi:hypothetical protein